MLDLLQTYRGKAGDKISEKGGSIFTKTCCLLAILSKDSKRALVRPRVFFLIAWFILAFCFSCMFWCYVYVRVIFFPLLAQYPLPVITELCRWENAIPRRGKQSPASAVWLRCSEYDTKVLIPQYLQDCDVAFLFETGFWWISIGYFALCKV